MEDEFVEEVLRGISLEKESERITKLAQKFATPNVHAILHLPNAAIEYGTTRNVVGWVGETKHS
jgi:hypothetical protein